MKEEKEKNEIEEAKKKCASLGKGWRLPNYGEWQVNFNANEKTLMEEWSKDGIEFWTSEEYSKDNAYYFIVDGGVYYFAKDYGAHTRCIR